MEIGKRLRELVHNVILMQIEEYWKLICFLPIKKGKKKLIYFPNTQRKFQIIVPNTQSRYVICIEIWKRYSVHVFKLNWVVLPLPTCKKPDICFFFFSPINTTYMQITNGEPYLYIHNYIYIYIYKQMESLVIFLYCIERSVICWSIHFLPSLSPFTVWSK